MSPFSELQGKKLAIYVSSNTNAVCRLIAVVLLQKKTQCKE